MDPDATFRAMTTLIRNNPGRFNRKLRAELRELHGAYVAWRNMGGFPAERATRDEFFAVYRRELHG